MHEGPAARRAFLRPSPNLIILNPSITMAIKLLANYSKKVGLPGFSSHQFSVSVETELVTTNDIAGESERLYHLLQSTVDGQILHTGFVPPADYGMEEPAAHQGSANPQAPPSGISLWQRGPAWKCTDKQKDLILKLVEEHQLDKSNVDTLAVERFGKGVRLLNKVEASGLIDELFATHGGDHHQGGGNPKNKSAYGGSNRRRAA